MDEHEVKTPVIQLVDFEYEEKTIKVTKEFMEKLKAEAKRQKLTEDAEKFAQTFGTDEPSNEEAEYAWQKLTSADLDLIESNFELIEDDDD